MGTGNDGQVESLAPTNELFNCGGAEGVGGSEEDGVALALEEVSEFGGGGRLSGAIDADDQKDGGFAIGAGLQGG